MLSLRINSCQGYTFLTYFYSMISAFLQNITKDSGMPYYFGTGVFSVASLLLLPFSKERQQDTTEIEVEVTEKDVHSVLKYTKHMQENIHNRDIEL